MKKQTLIEGIKQGADVFAKNITILINSLLLTIVYLIGVGLTTICAKIVRKSFLKTKVNKNTTTYWQDLNLKTESRENYQRQF